MAKKSNGSNKIVLSIVRQSKDGKKGTSKSVTLTKEAQEGILNYIEDTGGEYAEGQAFEELFGAVGLLKPRKWVVVMGVEVTAPSRSAAEELAKKKYPDADLEDIYEA